LGRGPVLRQRGVGEYLEGLAIGRYSACQMVVDGFIGRADAYLLMGSADIDLNSGPQLRGRVSCHIGERTLVGL
jgi:hypothetical protein